MLIEGGKFSWHRSKHVKFQKRYILELCPAIGDIYVDYREWSLPRCLHDGSKNDDNILKFKRRRHFVNVCHYDDILQFGFTGNFAYTPLLCFVLAVRTVTGLRVDGEWKIHGVMCDNTNVRKTQTFS